MEITYRNATSSEWPDIAELHVQSWQENYRGSFSDEYLDHQAYQERRKVWKKRMTKPAANQHVILALHNNRLCGFACTYGDHDSDHGSLLDNLHVNKEIRSHGIGAELLRRSAKWVFGAYPKIPFHLYVLKQNVKGISFYRRMGAQVSDVILSGTPDGGVAEVHRCTWVNLSNVK